MKKFREMTVEERDEFARMLGSLITKVIDESGAACLLVLADVSEISADYRGYRVDSVTTISNVDKQSYTEIAQIIVKDGERKPN